jgi:hypothetical protein
MRGTLRARGRRLPRWREGGSAHPLGTRASLAVGSDGDPSASGVTDLGFLGPSSRRPATTGPPRPDHPATGARRDPAERAFPGTTSKCPGIVGWGVPWPGTDPTGPRPRRGGQPDSEDPGGRQHPARRRGGRCAGGFGPRQDSRSDCRHNQSRDVGAARGAGCGCFSRSRGFGTRRGDQAVRPDPGGTGLQPLRGGPAGRAARARAWAWRWPGGWSGPACGTRPTRTGGPRRRRAC